MIGRRIVLWTARKLAAAAGHTVVENRATYAGFLPAEETRRAAAVAGRTVHEHAEIVSRQVGVTARVLDEMRTAGCLRPTDRVLEIGPGTGRFLDTVLAETKPVEYDFYEIADDWADWLLSTYGSRIRRKPTDGWSLKATPDASCGLVHAHGVLVYLKPVHAFAYLIEMARVCRRDGFVVFDFHPAEEFDEEVARDWIEADHDWPIPLDRTHVLDVFTRRDMRLIREFSVPSDDGSSRYVIFGGPGAPKASRTDARPQRLRSGLMLRPPESEPGWNLG